MWKSFVAILLCSCTFNTYETTEGDDMRGPKGLLELENASYIGRSVLITSNAPAAPPAGQPLIYEADTLILNPTPVAGIIHWQDFENILSVTAKAKYEQEVITLTASAMRAGPTGPVQAGLQVLLYGVLRFSDGGSSKFGSLQDANPPVVAGWVYITRPSQELLFDIASGTCFTIAADYVRFGIRYQLSEPLGFPAGMIPGPDYRVNIGLGYGTCRNREQLTKTDPNFNAAVAQGGVPAYYIAKPLFAKSFWISWVTWLDSAGDQGPLNLSFVNFNGTAIWDTSTRSPFSAAAIGAGVNNPTSYLFDWPADAEGVLITNNTDAQIPGVVVRHNLSL